MTKFYKDYLVYEDGRVFSNKINTRAKENKQIKPHLTKAGYLQLTLTFEGKQKKYKVHRLVALLFLENPNNYSEVNHKDGNKLNNHKDNLEWCTHQMNIDHSIVMRLKPMGEKHFYAKWTNKQIEQVREFLKNTSKTVQEISKETGVSIHSIYNEKSGSGRKT